MATKTHVDGERVTIDDSTYRVRSAGTGKYAVFDDFGGKLGTFTVTGKAITPEDYGVADMHPVLQIAKLWTAHHLSKSEGAAPATKGICRVVTHERPSAADMEQARAHRAWQKKQPGCKASYFAYDPATGKAMSISIWASRDELSAARDATPPDGIAPLKSAGVEVYPIVEEP